MDYWIRDWVREEERQCLKLYNKLHMNTVEEKVKAKLFDLYQQRTHLNDKNYTWTQQENGPSRKEYRYKNEVEINILESLLPLSKTVIKE